MTATTVRPAPVDRERHRTRRADRADALRLLWAVSTLPRVRECRRKPRPDSGLDGVGVRCSGSGAERSAGFAGLVVCGSAWSCPECSAKIAAGRQAELTAMLEAWRARGGGVALVTLTMRHHRGQSLSSLWDALSYAWNEASSGYLWQQLVGVYGTDMPRTYKSGARAGQTVTRPRLPVYRVVEVTVGPAGWHVHVHALVFLDSPRSDATCRHIGEVMWRRWDAALRRKGLDSLRDSGGLDARPFELGEALVDGFDYFTKHVYDGARATAVEVTRGDLKRARGANVSPFAVLARMVAGLVLPDGRRTKVVDAEDLATWQEWERSSRGRRQVAVTPGLRDFLALAEEATDEQLAEEDVGGDLLLVISARSWSTWHRRPGFRAGLLDAAECDDTGDTLRAFLAARRVVWRPPPVPRLRR